MGRPAHQPDPVSRRQVEAMAGYGIPEPGIGRIVGIDPKTLRKHYRAELATGHDKATAKIAESLYRKAMGDGPQSVAACIFWLKTRAGWKETSVQELTGKGAEPVTVIIRKFVNPPYRPDDLGSAAPTIEGATLPLIEYQKDP